MDSSKFPDFSGNKTKICLFFLVFLGILIVEMSFLALSIQKGKEEESKLSSSLFAGSREAGLFLEENVFTQEKLLLFNENTLISVANPFNPEPKIVKKLQVIVTAYSSTVCQTDSDPFITAAGTWVRKGIVANNKYPFGTKIRIPEIFGDEVFVVEDRMHWRKGHYHVDVWFPEYLEAFNFGVKRTYIEVLES